MFPSKADTTVKPTSAVTNGSCEIQAGRRAEPGESSPGATECGTIPHHLTAEVGASLLRGRISIPANRLSGSINTLTGPDSGYMVAVTRRHLRGAGSAPLGARLPPDDPVVVR